MSMCLLGRFGNLLTAVASDFRPYFAAVYVESSSALSPATTQQVPVPRPYLAKLEWWVHSDSTVMTIRRASIDDPRLESVSSAALL
jgi:hypothetical protein